MKRNGSLPLVLVNSAVSPKASAICHVMRFSSDNSSPAMSIGAFLSPELGLIINSPPICRPLQDCWSNPQVTRGPARLPKLPEGAATRNNFRFGVMWVWKRWTKRGPARRREDPVPGGAELGRTRRSICTVGQISTAFDSRLRAPRLVHDLFVVAGAETPPGWRRSQPFGGTVTIPSTSSHIGLVWVNSPVSTGLERL